MSKKQKPISPAPIPARALAGVAIVAALSLFGTMNYYQFLSAYSRAYTDPYQIAAQRDRLLDVIATVPAGATVGYLSDVPLASPQGSAEFAGARYALAPRMLASLERGLKPEWVIANFTRPEDAARAGAQLGLSVARDYGTGIVLLRRKSH